MPLLSRVAHDMRAYFRRVKPRVSADRPLAVIAHRGAADHAPPNSLRACGLALDLGATGVEVDVCVTGDCVGVLWHDRDPAHWISLARQFGFEGCPYIPTVPDWGRPEYRPIAQLSCAEFLEHYGVVRKSESGIGVDGTAEVVVPDTLRAFVEWAAGESRVQRLLLDVKLSPEELDKVEPLIDELSGLCRDDSQLTSRTWHLLTTEVEVFERLRDVIAARRLDWLSPTADYELPFVAESARTLRARHVSIGTTPARLWTTVRLDLMEAIEARNRGELESVGIWTLNEPHLLREVAHWGVDYVLTDRPKMAADVVAACSMAPSLAPTGGI